MKEYLTTWCCPDTGAEYDIKIEYTLIPAQAARTNPDDNPCPAVDAEIDIDAIYRREVVLINGAGDVGSEWVEWNDESDDDLEDWKQEILIKEAEE